LLEVDIAYLLEFTLIVVVLGSIKRHHRACMSHQCKLLECFNQSVGTTVSPWARLIQATMDRDALFSYAYNYACSILFKWYCSIFSF